MKHWLGKSTTIVAMTVGVLMVAQGCKTEKKSGRMDDSQHSAEDTGTAAATGPELVNTAGSTGIALDGYDPVAFFTDGRPTHGNFKITATHQGATYFFASEKNKQMFESDPQAYAPQYGGYCAFGVAAGALFPVDIDTWQIRNDKLYLNLNPGIVEQFNNKFDSNVAQADKNWPDLVNKNSE